MKYSVQLIMYIVTSIVSASAIVVVTKRLYHLYGFKWPTCLIFVHQGSVAVVTWSASTLGYTERPKFTAFAIMGGCLSAFSLFLLNLSLWYNSVGTFQTFKLLTVPCIATIDYFYVGKRFTMPQILALLLMVAGTGLVTVDEISMRGRGLIFGTLATVLTSVHQQTQKRVADTYQLTNMQTMQVYCSVCAPWLLGFALCMDPVPELLNYDWSLEQVVHLLASCFVFYFVAFSMVGIVNAASPLVFQVVGLLKVILVFVAGLLFVDSHCTVMQTAGVLASSLGFTLYTFAPKEEAKTQTHSETADGVGDTEMIKMEQHLVDKVSDDT